MKGFFDINNRVNLPFFKGEQDQNLCVQSTLLRNYIQSVSNNPAKLNPPLNKDVFEFSNTNNNPIKQVSDTEKNEEDTNSLKLDTDTKIPDKKEDKKKLKAAMIATALASGAAGVSFILGAAKSGKLTPTTIFRNIDENSTFQPAKTVKEAVEYGKNTLKIKNYIGFDKGSEEENLQVINWINEGLTNTAKRHNGTLLMPNEIVYTTANDSNTIAYMSRGYTLDGALVNATLGINSSILGKIDDEVNELLKHLKRANLYATGRQKASNTIYDTEEYTGMAKLIEQYRKNNLSYNEKIRLYNIMRGFANNYNALIEQPAICLKNFLKEEGIPCTEEYMKRFTTGNIEKDRGEVLKELRKYITNGKFRIKTPNASPFQTLYHEMGHLQDTTKRAPATVDFKEGETFPKELEDWLNDPKNMEAAYSVSTYATTGPGEFIAEVYARLMGGAKLPNHVLDLYKKMNGPVIQGMQT